MKTTIFLTFTSLFLLLPCLFSGCKPESQKYDSFKAKISQMDVKLLRALALNYKKELENNQYKILSELFNNIAPADAPFTPEMATSIATAFSDQLTNISNQNILSSFDFDMINRYLIICEKIREKGGDTSDLEFDLFQLEKNRDDYYIPPRNDYLFPPTKPFPDPHIEYEITEPT